MRSEEEIRFILSYLELTNGPVKSGDIMTPANVAAETLKWVLGEKSEADDMLNIFPPNKEKDWKDTNLSPRTKAQIEADRGW